MSRNDTDRLTVGEAAIRSLSELRQRIDDMAKEYERDATAGAPRGVHPREVARDLRRLLEN